ncbi:TPA: hypothetical protein PQY58_001391 [Staphylococcus aureus]|nr:hypothetical protein [Staphylococcus aureus]
MINSILFLTFNVIFLLIVPSYVFSFLFFFVTSTLSGNGVKNSFTGSFIAPFKFQTTTGAMFIYIQILFLAITFLGLIKLAIDFY